MRYAILEQQTGLPIGYFDAERPPASLEELADHLAEWMGYATRDELIDAKPNLSIGYDRVH